MTDKTELDNVEYFGEDALRWYQVAAKNKVVEVIKQGVRRALIVLPTGAGKTITLASTMDCPRLREALEIPNNRPLRVLFVAHLQRLLTQAERTFSNGNNTEVKLTTPHVKIPAEHVEWADMIVIDEAHHEAMMSVQYQLDTLKHKPIIGLTATPDRADGMLIKFEEIIDMISREQAVKEGYLAETSIWSFVDLTGKNKVAISKSIIKHYKDVFGQTIAFFSTKKEAHEVCHFINSLGINAVMLDKQTPTEVDDILDDFSQGKVNWVINCGRLGEGVDVKGCTSVFLGRQIGSYPLLNQIIGRASRPDSDCRVFELVNPLSGYNLDTTTVTGTPKRHVLCSYNKKTFKELEFNHVSAR